MVVKYGKEQSEGDNRGIHWMVITDPTANVLFVLARNVEEFMDRHVDEVLCHTNS